MFKVMALSLVTAFTLVKPMDGADPSIEKPEKVVVYNWSEYIPEGVLEDFTRETGIKVEYSTYDNNEVMYTRLKLLRGRGYDVIVPSTNLVERMIKEGLVQSLDHRQLKNLESLDPNLLDKPYDPKNTYSVPYLWGTTGIGINTQKVSLSEVKSWQDLWQKKWKGRLLFTDDMREIFHMALVSNGHSTNSEDPEELKQAYDKLRRLMPLVKEISGEEQHKHFLDDEVDIGVMWNGEMVVAQEKNASFKYIYPQEGASVWIDSFVIPSRATNVDNAHAFIDYMLRPEVAARCVEELGYATASLPGKGLLKASVRNNPTIFPEPKVLANTEFQVDLSKQGDNLYKLYWEKLKASRQQD